MITEGSGETQGSDTSSLEAMITGGSGELDTSTPTAPVVPVEKPAKPQFTNFETHATTTSPTKSSRLPMTQAAMNLASYVFDNAVKPAASATLGYIADKRKENALSSFELKQLMYRDSQDPLHYVTENGKKRLTNNAIEAFRKASTDEEKLALVSQQDKEAPLIKALNTPTGKAVTKAIAQGTTNMPLKAYARLLSVGDQTYEEAYAALVEKANDPNNPYWQKILYQVQNSGVQSAVGALLALSVSALTRSSNAGLAASGAYFSAISAEEERAKSASGDIESMANLENIAVDTVGDTLISGVAESALKAFAKEGGKSGLKALAKEGAKGFLVEGTTEPTQSLLKYANDYTAAANDAQRKAVSDSFATYVKTGAMFDEFLVGGIAGGVINVAASGAGQMVNYVAHRSGGAVKPEELENVKAKFRDDVEKAVETGDFSGVVEGIQATADVDTENATKIVQEIVSDSVADNALVADVSMGTDANKALLEDIRTAIEQGFAASDVSEALQLRYNMESDVAEQKVAEAIKAAQTASQEAIQKPEDAKKSESETKPATPESQKQEVIPENPKDMTDEQLLVKFKEHGTQTGGIFQEDGNGVPFLVMPDGGTYSLPEFAKHLQEQYTNAHGNKSVPKPAKNKRGGKSKGVSDSKGKARSAGGSTDGNGEAAVQHGGTDAGTTDHGTKPAGKRPLKLGDVIDTKGNSNMEGHVTVTDVTKRSVKFTDATGREYSSFDKSTAEKLIQAGEWEHVTAESTEKKPEAQNPSEPAAQEAEAQPEAQPSEQATEAPAEEVTNEQIDAAVKLVTSIDPNTGEVTISSKDLRLIEATTELAEKYKTGGTEKEGRGILDEYYTDKKIVSAVYSFLEIEKGAKVLEPSIGIGNFVPTQDVSLTGYEINPTTAGLSKLLNPRATIFNKSFESYFIDERGNKKSFTPEFDLVVGNPPYGEHRGLYKGLGEEENIAKYEDYFTKRGLDVVKEGGHVVFVLPSSFLQSERANVKEAIAKLGYVEYAFRLPEEVFAGTSVGTDIVVLKKEALIAGGSVEARVSQMTGGRYFMEHPENVLGEVKERKNRFGRIEEYVEGSLDGALSKLNSITVEKIAVGIAEKAGVEPTNENIEAIKTVVDESSTNDVEKIVEEDKKEETAEEKKRKEREAKKSKKIIDKIKKNTTSNAKQFKIIDKQKKSFTSDELEHWAARLQDGSIDPKFTVNKEIASFFNGKWYPNFTYLQGNIYEKLEQLESDKPAMGEEQYKKQKKALTAILPPRVKLTDMKLNANSAFIKDFTSTNIEATDYYGRPTGEHSLVSLVRKYVRNAPREMLGTNLMVSDVLDYIDGISVRGRDKDQNAMVRKLRPVVANEMLNRFFVDLKQENKALYEKVEEAYNRTFNAVHIPDYSEVPLTITVNNSLNGKPFAVTDVQQQGAGRLVEKGVGILAHDVGFGKTLTSILATYQNMQNGHTKKPLFIVPKATYQQWVNTISEIIPNAKINSLYNLADGYQGDLSTLKINDGEFNIVTEEGFKRIAFKNETYDKYAAKYAYATDDLNSEKTTRQQEKAKEEGQQNKGRMVRGSRTDLYFEELGFDHIVIDEVHGANNIITKIKMPKEKATEFRAISKPSNPSQYGVKAWLASQYVQDNNNGKNVYLLSATPFTNSPLQYFSILSLVANRTMEQMGVENVNDFLNQFMDIQMRLEYKPNGTFKERQVIRSFKNFVLLRKLLGEYIDFKNGEDNPQLIRPDKHQRVNTFAKSEDYIAAEQTIQRDYSGSKQVLQLIGQLRALSISSALLKDQNPDIAKAKEIVENSPKLYAIAQNIIANQKANKKAGRVATEIVYTPFGVEILPIFKQYLIKYGGMKADEIGIITGETTSDKRSELQNDFNGVDEDGKPAETKLRVLMGTDTIGTGLNLQKRTTDIHFLGLPWNFTDLMQVEGRAWRQGNKWRNVRMNHYLMENSYDTVHFQILTSKQKRYELAIKNNENEVDVGDVDVEKHLADLITDPALIAELRLTQDIADTAEQLRAVTAELSYSTQKVEKLRNAQEEVTRAENTIRKYRSDSAEAQTEYTKKYYSDEADKLEKKLPKLIAEVDEMRKYYSEQGVDVAQLEKKLAPLSAEEKVLSAKLDTLKTNETKKKYIEQAQKDIKKVDPFKLSDVQPMLARYADEQGTFYTLENRKPEDMTKTEEEKAAEIPDVNTASTKPKKSKKLASTKEQQKKAENEAKPVRKTKVKPLKLSPELGIVTDTALSPSEKVVKLLDRKQEGKAHKDAGSRVAGSKKERAAIDLVYKHGDSATMAEMIRQLGWESVLEVVDKHTILEGSGVENTIQTDFENQVPARVAKARKAIFDSIYKVPKLAGAKRKWSVNHYLWAQNDSGSRSSARPEQMTEFAKIYPSVLKQVVGKILAYTGKSTTEEAPYVQHNDIYIDATGNVLEFENRENAFWVLDSWAVIPKGLLSDMQYATRGKYNYETREYETIPFVAADYELLLNPTKKQVNKANDAHGNFDAIDAYDITDKDIARAEVTTENLREKYGFESVQLGNYMDDESSFEHIQQTMGAVKSMSEALGLDLIKIIKSRKLSIAYGARGGTGALAHYEPSKNIINITKKRGDGSFGHEFMHFLDFTAKTGAGRRISQLYRRNERRYYPRDKAGIDLMGALIDGRYKGEKVYEPNDKPLGDFLNDYYWSHGKKVSIDIPEVVKLILDRQNETGDASLMPLYINKEGKPTWNRNESSEYPYWNSYTKVDPQLIANLLGKPFKGKYVASQSDFRENAIKHLGGGKESYWSKPEELLARAFQAYLEDKMLEKGVYNKYATRTTIAESEASFLAFAYPQGEERKAFNKLFDSLFSTNDNFGNENTRYKLASDTKVEKTVTGEFLEEAKKRLGVDFNVQFFDTILGQSGEAWGVVARNAIGLAKDAPYTTEHHELLHLTLANLQKIQPLAHLSREAILKEKAAQLGIPEQWNTDYVEEQLAEDFERYVEGKQEQKGLIAQLFEWIKKQIALLRSALAKKPRLIEQYFDLLYAGQATDAAVAKLSDEHAFADFVYFNTLFAHQIELADEGSLYKEKIDAAIGKYSALVSEVKGNKSLMEIVAKYAEKSSLNDVVRAAHKQVEQFVRMSHELADVRNDIEFVKLVAKVKETREARELLASKLETIDIKTKNAGKKAPRVNRTIVSEAAASEINATPEGETPTGAELVEGSTVSKPEGTMEPTPAGKRISTFQHRMLQLLAEENRHDAYYDSMSKIEEVAKAEAYYEANKKRTIAMAQGKEAVPAGISHNVLALVVIAKAQEAKDSKTVARTMKALSLRATKQGQEIAMLANAFGERDPETYMRKLIAERIHLAKRKYKPLFSPTDTSPIEKIITRKVAEAKKKSPTPLNEQLQTKAKEIDDFLASITC